MLPVIGLSSAHRVVESSAGEERAHLLYAGYTTMVREAGGIPVVLAPMPDDAADLLLDRIDGLVLTGGGDVNPHLYGGESSPTVHDVDPERDAYELALARAAAGRKMPLLAICRGMQLLNVALGGTLLENIRDSMDGALEHRIRGERVHEGVHQVAVEPDSTMAAVLGSTSPTVNSVHHQSIGRLADPLRVTACAPDGVVEAVEPIDASWPMWAVQWHPEWLGPADAPSLRLFAALVEAARVTVPSRRV